MIVSTIRQTSPGRLTVGFADGDEIKTTLGVITDMRLFPGKELDDTEFEAFRRESLRSLTREKAIEYLSARPMSKAELYKKLIDKGSDVDTAAYCADWLEENRLLDDESYAASLARHYSAKGYGAGRIRAELSRRGIDRELWDGAVNSVTANTAKIDRFISSRLDDPTDRDAVRKVSAALYRRGFSWEEIRGALERFNAEPEDM